MSSSLERRVKRDNLFASLAEAQRSQAASTSGSSEGDVLLSGGNSDPESFTEDHIRLLINKYTTCSVFTYDFTEAIAWTATCHLGFKRLRHELVSEKAPLYELQQSTRILHEGLELERSTLAAVYKSIQAFASDEPERWRVDTMLRDFNASFARVIGKGIVQTADSHGTVGIGELLILGATGDKQYWHAVQSAGVKDDEIQRRSRCYDFVDICENTFGCVDLEAMNTVNKCLVRMVSLGFLASYHYSLVRREFYFGRFKKLLAKALTLSKLPLDKNAAVTMIAGAQSEEKKANLLLTKFIRGRAGSSATTMGEQEQQLLQTLLADFADERQYHERVSLFRIACIMTSHQFERHIQSLPSYRALSGSDDTGVECAIEKGSVVTTNDVPDEEEEAHDDDDTSSADYNPFTDDPEYQKYLRELEEEEEEEEDLDDDGTDSDYETESSDQDDYSSSSC